MKINSNQTSQKFFVLLIFLLSFSSSSISKPHSPDSIDQPRNFEKLFKRQSNPAATNPAAATTTTTTSDAATTTTTIATTTTTVAPTTTTTTDQPSSSANTSSSTSDPGTTTSPDQQQQTTTTPTPTSSVTTPGGSSNSNNNPSLTTPGPTTTTTTTTAKPGKSSSTTTTVVNVTQTITVNGTPTQQVVQQTQTGVASSGKNSSSKTWVIVGAVAGGIVGLAGALFLIFKLTQQRFSSLDDEDGNAIKWPELVRDGDNVNGSSLNPIVARRREGAGVEMSEVGSHRDSFENVGFETGGAGAGANLNRAPTTLSAFGGGGGVQGQQYFDDPNRAYYDPYLGQSNTSPTGYPPIYATGSAPTPAYPPQPQIYQSNTDPNSRLQHSTTMSTSRLSLTSSDLLGYTQTTGNGGNNVTGTGGYQQSEVGYNPSQTGTQSPPHYGSAPNSYDGDHQFQKQYQQMPYQQAPQQTQEYPTGEPLGIVRSESRQSLGFGNSGKMTPGGLH